MASPSHRIRLLALDVDGTLLDGRGGLRPRTARAVRDVTRHGIVPVLCTGRRFRRARPVAEELGLDAPIVCNSGTLVKEALEGKTLLRADFDEALFGRIAAMFRARGEPAVSFLDDGPGAFDFAVATETTGRPLFDEYVDLNRRFARVDPDWGGPGSSHFHVCAIGERPAMLAFEEAVHATLPGLVRTFVQKSPAYSGTMCELLHRDASKWSAVLHLADLWGIVPEEICAVGDDMNDLPMIAGAGLGVAMAHAPKAVLDVADIVTGTNDEDGLAAFLEAHFA